MKAIGIVRNVDDLGRLVIPKEVRSSLNIPTGTSMEFFIDGDKIVIGKYQKVNTCTACGSKDVSVEVKQVKLCPTCLSNLKSRLVD